MATNQLRDEVQMVTFVLGREEYAVDVMDVREIIETTQVTKVANSPGHVEGVIDLRGSIVPIVSLRKRLALPGDGPDACGCVAVMDYAGVLTGFVIDEVSDVIRVARSEILPPLDLGSQPWVQGVLSMERKLVVVMDLRHLA